jgi:chemotaxis family two-component system response regulator Rcp1
MSNNDRPIDVLLVEDHPGDARLAQEAFRHCCRPIRLHHAWNGVEAMMFLRREGIHVDAPQPSLILLDLKMPQMSGDETLRLIKKDPGLIAIPVIVLTTSENDAEVTACYKLGASCYLLKPAQWDAFDALINSIDVFWFANSLAPLSSPAK